MNKLEKKAMKNSLGMFDLYKGLVMVTVLVAHTYGFFDNIDFLPKQIFVTLFSIFGDSAMAGLMLLGGYGFRKTTFKKCAKKQFHILIIPYIVTAVFAIIVRITAYTFFVPCDWMSEMKKTVKQVAGYLFGFPYTAYIGGFEIPPSGPIWFLLAMAIGNIIFNEYLNRFEGKKLFGVCLITATIGWVLAFLGSLPWCIPQALISTLFLSFGYFAKKKKSFLSNENRGLKFAILVGGMAIYLITKVFNMEYSFSYGIFTLGPISMLFISYMACVIIYWFLRLNKYTGFIADSLRGLGRNSLYVLCAHAVELTGISSDLQYNFVNNWQGPIWIRNTIILGIRVPVVIGLTYGFIWLRDNCYKFTKKI